jgi:hypothetical protein
MDDKHFKPISINAQAKARLEFLSKKSSIPQAKLLENYIDCLFAVGMYFEKFGLVFDYDNAENTVVTIFRGIKSKKDTITFGLSKTEQDMINSITAKINSDLNKKAKGLD